MKTLIKKLKFLQDIYNSPFKRLKLKWYFGKIACGTPYFLPRRWVNSKAIPIKFFGINYNGLGWKIKWSNTDYRFEFNPGLSIVLFGLQLMVWLLPNVGKDSLEISSYWEAFLVYNNHTNKNLSVENRLKECRKLYSCTWSNNNSKTDYYNYILKKKYL